ncbi:MAG: hypothetical protein IPH44_04905 [Myxococcales bacterium]|nr:hypothetical protein [Myxococcales bacterium]
MHAAAALVIATTCLAVAPAHADRLSLEISAGAGTFANAGNQEGVGPAFGLGVGVAPNRSLAIELRLAQIRLVGSDHVHPSATFLGPAVRAFASRHLFLGLGLGVAGADGLGPAIAARVGVAFRQRAHGSLHVTLEAMASAATDGDSDGASALALTIGYLGR